MPGRKRGETRTMRDMTLGETHQMSLVARMDPGVYTSHLVSQKPINEALREYGLLPRSTLYSSDLPTPVTFKEANELDSAQIWIC